MSEYANAQELKQIDELHAALTGPTAAAAVDLCGIWKVAAPYWGTVVSIVSKVPVIGWIVGPLLTAFGAAMNACCPNTKHATAAAGIDVSADEVQHLSHAYLEVFGVSAGGSGAAAAASSKPCCNIWDKVKKYWPTIVSVVSKIPVIGSKIGPVLKALGDALNNFCK
jgi:hypothetical protein